MQRESKSSTERKSLVEGGAGAPMSYPGEDLWPSNTIPPGSHYTQAEWDAARQGDGHQRFEVMEIQSSQKSMLIQLAIPELVSSRKMVNGVIVTQTREVASDGAEQSTINSLLRQIYSDCLLVSSDSYPRFFGATEADFTWQASRYRVIRPRTDYLHSERAFRVGAKLTGESFEEQPKAEIICAKPQTLEIGLQDSDNSDDTENEQTFSPSS